MEVSVDNEYMVMYDVTEGGTPVSGSTWTAVRLEDDGSNTTTDKCNKN